MSVDKFGRYSEFRSYFEKTEGFPQTPDGDYDVGNKRLKRVNDPKDENDAINLKYLKNETISSLKLDGDNYNAISKKITNLHDPEGMDHAVNVNYIARLMGEILYNFNNKLVQHDNKVVHLKDKNMWIDQNVIQKYFLDHERNTKMFRTHYK